MHGVWCEIVSDFVKLCVGVIAVCECNVWVFVCQQCVCVLTSVCVCVLTQIGIPSRDSSAPVFLARNISQHLAGTARTIGAALVGHFGTDDSAYLKHHQADIRHVCFRGQIRWS